MTILLPPVVELRQYTLVPGQRDTLIELFDRELAAPQEQVGMRLLGQFRDLDDPNRFVWLRGFPSMEKRAASLAAFYGGPIWRAHRDAANATMVDSDDVLLLRPLQHPTTLPAATRGSEVSVDVYPLAHPLSEETRAALVDTTGVLLDTESAPNSFPALPVREAEQVLVRLSVGDDPLPASALDALRAVQTGPPQQLRLSPTAGSRWP